MTQHLSEPRVTLSTMRHFRDADRRRYRKNIIYLLVYQVLVVVAARICVDVLLANILLKDVQFLRPYAIIVPLIFFVMIWLVGLHVAFRRSY